VAKRGCQQVSIAHQTVHLCHWDPKFIPPLIRFVNERFGEAAHRFVIYGAAQGEAEIPPNGRLIYGHLVGVKDAARLRGEIARARRVIVHGLFNNRIAVVLASVPRALPRCRWVIWGGDLYDRSREPRNLRWQVATAVRRFVCSRLGGIAALIPGDVDKARHDLSFRGPHFQCLGYLSNTFLRTERLADPPALPTILVGNSATPSNQHRLAFELLARFRRQDIRVLCPLSYGDKNYADKVVAEGRAVFGDRFTALRGYLDPAEFAKVLDSVTIAIFAHDRQQAVGNCIQLLGRGVRIHLDPTTSHYSYFRSEGFPVGRTDSIELRPLDPGDRIRCHELACEVFSESCLESQYRAVFD
jgi:hypothetical protein